MERLEELYRDYMGIKKDPGGQEYIFLPSSFGRKREEEKIFSAQTVTDAIRRIAEDEMLVIMIDEQGGKMDGSI